MNLGIRMDRKGLIKDIYYFIFIKFLLLITPSLNLSKKETFETFDALNVDITTLSVLNKT